MRSEIERLVTELSQTPGIVVFPPHGDPRPKSEDALPADLQRFYELCSGMTLFSESDYPARIVGLKGCQPLSRHHRLQGSGFDYFNRTGA
jgi:hypothetical protein